MLDKIFDELFEDLDGLTKTGAEDAFFQTVCKRLGLTNAAYLGVNLPKKTNREYYVHNTYSKDWALHYETENYVAIDPIVRRGLLSLMPIDWSDMGKLSPEQAKFFGEAQDFRIGRQGLTFPLHGLHNETAIFSISADYSDRDWKDLKRQTLRELRVIGDFFHQKVLGDIGATELKSQPKLTEREVECLKWSAEGKTYQEIGMILGVSARTVRFFLEGAKSKLNCLNTTHAVVTALHRGII